MSEQRVVGVAQDPVDVDSSHYTVELENDRVRVLRIRYGPGEKSKMHGHPASVGVFLTDAQGRFTYPDGKPPPSTVGGVGLTVLVPRAPYRASSTRTDLLRVVLSLLSTARSEDNCSGFGLGPRG